MLLSGWLVEGNSKLGKHALNIIDTALHERNLGVATISFLEIAMLLDQYRFSLKKKLEA